MIILSLRTDQPEAAIGLFEDGRKLAYETWQAHRTLSETMHSKIKQLLNNQHKQWSDINGIICFQGPGSFTGLRIGLSVSNALAYSLSVPIVATQGKTWLDTGLKQLAAGKNDTVVTPDYGREAHITKPKK